MKALLKTPSLLSGLFDQPKAGTPIPEPVEQAPLENNWTNWEADIILTAQYNHQLLSAHLPDTVQTLQTLILGADLFSSELLLDGLYPFNWLEINTLKRNRTPVWLQIRTEQGFYRLKTTLCEIHSTSKNPAVTVKIQHAYFTDNRRWNNRVSFDKRCGPSVEMQVKYQAQIKGWLADISRQGCMIETYGQHNRPEFKEINQLDCIFHFNEFFELSINTRVKQSRYFRSPCCFSQTRLIFNKISQTQQEQIDEFIEMNTSTYAEPASIAV